MNPALGQQRLGALDFINMIYRGHPEYSVIAVKAPIEDVIQAFTEICENRKTRLRDDWRTFRKQEYKLTSRTLKWEQNLVISPAQEWSEEEQASEDFDGGDEIAPGIPFLQICGSEWTVIPKMLFYLTGDEIDDAGQEIKLLSEKLQTRALVMMEEDTSGALAYELYEYGNQIEKFEHCDDEVQFESSINPEPDIASTWDDEDEDWDDDQPYDVATEPRNQHVDNLFHALGIYLPACYPVADGDKTSIAVLSTSVNTIERADLLILDETWELPETERKELSDDDAE